MTPRQFLEQIVRPNVVEFHANCANMRHAYNAVAAVDALAAHLRAPRIFRLARAASAPALLHAVGDGEDEYCEVSDVAERRPAVLVARLLGLPGIGRLPIDSLDVLDPANIRPSDYKSDGRIQSSLTVQ